jgi:hypothetical protein
MNINLIVSAAVTSTLTVFSLAWLTAWIIERQHKINLK